MKADRGALFWAGDGGYECPVVGESHYQDALDAICGGRREDGHEMECVARLDPEPNNPYDPNAVAVTINGRKVGHLPRHFAASYVETLRSLGIAGRSVSCQAEIVGGWDRGKGDRGHYGVRLDIEQPMRLEKAGVGYNMREVRRAPTGGRSRWRLMVVAIIVAVGLYGLWKRYTGLM